MSACFLLLARELHDMGSRPSPNAARKAPPCAAITSLREQFSVQPLMCVPCFSTPRASIQLVEEIEERFTEEAGFHGGYADILEIVTDCAPEPEQNS